MLKYLKRKAKLPNIKQKIAIRDIRKKGTKDLEVLLGKQIQDNYKIKKI